MKLTIPKFIIQLKEQLTMDRLQSNINKLKKNPKNKELVALVEKKIKNATKAAASSSGLSSYVTSIVGVFITLSVGLVVLGQLQKSISVDSVGPITGLAYNATGPMGTMANNAVGQLPSLMGIMVIVSLVSILAFGFMRS